MALQIHVNGIERTSIVLWETLVWDQAQTYKPDFLTFSVQKFGSRTFAPVLLDEVTLTVDSDKVFGGHIVAVNQNVDAYDRLIYEVTIKDYSHKMDRLLVQESYTEKPVINIICDILNKYVNKTTRVEIGSFETDEIWNGGTVDTVNFRIGEQARKLTSTGTVVTTNRSLFLDLTANSLGTSDYIDIDVYVDTLANLSSCVLKLGDVTLTNYFSKDITAQITATGWNYVRVLKSAFSSTGSPAWNNITFQQIEVTAVGVTTVNVTFDNWQALSATLGYTRSNALTATQVVSYIAFNFMETSKCLIKLAQLFLWQWYVDENKDIHFFAKFEEGAPFNLTDDGGKYVYRSLLFNQNADQLRNSIFVRGGEYLGPSLTEDLSVQVDGVAKIFKVGYNYDVDTMTLTLVVTEKAVGIDNIDAYADNEGVKQTSIGSSQLKVGDASGREKQSQQIIAERKGRRTKVKIRLRKVGTPVDNFQIQIFSDDGSNKPSATNLSTVATLAGGSITTSFVEYTFTLTEASTNTLLLTKNTKFHIVASRSAANDAANYYEIDVFTNIYDGKIYSGDATPVWTENTSYDWYFIEVLGFDALYNADEKIVTFNTAPPNGNALTLTAQPKQPVLIQYKDNSSVAIYGEYQFKVEDETILSQEAARQRALEEIIQWATGASEATFRTYQNGLRVGQTINVQSTIRGLNTDFFVNKVSARAKNPSALEYQVGLTSAKTMGIIYYLQGLLIDQDEKLVDDTELLAKIEGVSEMITFVDTSVTPTLYTGKVWSDDAGTTANKLIWDGGLAHIWI